MSVAQNCYMILLIAVAVLLAVTLAFTLSVRANDIPKPEPVSPTQHLEERKASIYENLRDLQFEYRVGKLSDSDYQQTKLSLQKELAVVLAEIQRLSGAAVKAEAPVAVGAGAQAGVPALGAKKAPGAAVVCAHCGAEFAAPMKFCGECGKEMR